MPRPGIDAEGLGPQISRGFAAGPRIALASARRRRAMKTSLISLIGLAMPLASCIKPPPDDCQNCCDPFCPPSTVYSPRSVPYSPPTVIPTSGQGPADSFPTRSRESSAPDAGPAPTGCRDAGAGLPAPATGADAGVAVPSLDASTADAKAPSALDSGGLADRTADSTTPSPCTDAGACGKPVERQR